MFKVSYYAIYGEGIDKTIKVNNLVQVRKVLRKYPLRVIADRHVTTKNKNYSCRVFRRCSEYPLNQVGL